MNKYLSVIELNMRRSLWKVILVLAIVSAGELGLCALRLKSSEEMSLYMAGAGLCKMFTLALAAVCILLGGDPIKNTDPEIMLRRLKVSGTAAYVLTVAYDIAVLLFTWAVQILTLLAAIKIYTGSAAYGGGPQGPIVEIYSHPGLLCILPLESRNHWIFTSMAVVSLALAAAYMAVVRRRRGFPILSTFIIICVVGAFILQSVLIVYDIDGGFFVPPLIIAMFAACSALLAVLSVRGKEDKEVDDGE